MQVPHWKMQAKLAKVFLKYLGGKIYKFNLLIPHHKVMPFGFLKDVKL
jgi:hypothetical protein